MKPWAYVILSATAFILVVFASPFVLLRPMSGSAAEQSFEVKQGEGFRQITNRLKGDKLIRSTAAFEFYGLLTANIRHLKPGIYGLSPASSSQAIMQRLVSGVDRETLVTVPEGSSIFDIDELLSKAGVLGKGEFRRLAEEQKLEGKLFPDTYRFYFNSSPEDVFQKFAENFDQKLKPILPEELSAAKETLILASLLEKEVQSDEDRKIVAGILLKRLKDEFPLQVDATVCYAKRERDGGKPCYPVTVLDTQMESPYNTYLHKGLPPGPIGNPGVSAVLAALSPVKSPYWYYLTDPVTKQTIFSKTLEEHETNRDKYLLQPTH